MWKVNSLRGSMRINRVIRSGCLILFLIAVSLIFLTSVQICKAEGRIRIAVFPFENFSGEKEAVQIAIPLLKDRLRSKGYEIIEDDSMNNFMLKERLRNTGCVCHDIAIKMGRELNAQAILTGTVNMFVGGDNPRVGFTARLINTSDGSVIWANHAAATGEDFTGILGIGRVRTVERLTEKVLDRVLRSFSVSLPGKETEAVYRIAVMPFQNMSKVKDSGNIAAYMFITELFKNRRYSPVEYGEVRRLIVDLRVREKGEMDLKNIAAIAQKAGIDGILVGSVDTYRDGSGTDIAPEAEISARLIDARKGRIIWCNSYQVRGDDDIFMLDWGRIRSVENAAYKVVTKLVKDMGNAKWK